MSHSINTSQKGFSRKSGFTLIELSIVLIIIGLLVAGVTGGASLIKSAQLRSLMSEARGYSVATSSFVTQYDKLPGDYSTAINSSETGNNNGQINFIDVVTSGSLVKLEGVIAWDQLKKASVIDNVLTMPTLTFSAAALSPALTVGTNIPASKLDGVGWVFDYTSSRNVLVATGNVAVGTSNFVMTAATNALPVGAITPSDALSVDTKLDDGVANAGRVRGSAASSITNCFSTTTYTTGTTTKACAIEFTIDS